MAKDKENEVIDIHSQGYYDNIINNSYPTGGDSSQGGYNENGGSVISTGNGGYSGNSGQNTSISYTSPMQNTQTKIINEFVSKYGSGMNEANVGILLNNIKSISGGEVTGQSKELVKQVYSTWFQSNFGMDTANIKIFNDRCISIFGKPIEIGAFKSTEDLHGSIVSKFTSEYGMDTPNTGILLNKIKSETGAEASKSTKEMIKQKHAQWFVQKYTLDEYNMKILDKSCITLFTSPTNPSTAILKLSNILLDDSHVPYITSMMANNNCPNLIYLDLRDNFLGDYSASLLATSISKGEMPSLKVTHLEGNKITKTGEGFLIKVLKQISQDIMVTLEKYSTDLGQKVIKPALKEFVKYAEKNGVDTTHIATNKSTWEYMKDISKIGGKTIFGYAKCSNIIIDMLTFDTTLPSLAKSATIEMYGSKAVKNTDLKVCVILETYDAIVSPEGVDLAVKAIDLLGDGE